MSQKIQIRVTDVLAMLKDGKTREEIGEHYGLNKADTKALFSIPQLKGKRTRKQRPFQIILDEADEVENEDLPQNQVSTEQTIEETFTQQEVVEDYVEEISTEPEVEGISTEQESVEDNIEVEENTQEDISSSWEN